MPSSVAYTPLLFITLEMKKMQYEANTGGWPHAAIQSCKHIPT
jgi:hypothetical protein